MTMPEFATVAGITVICFLVGLAVKASPLDDKYIPIVVGVVGGALGVAGLYTMEAFPVDNVIDAVAVGIASGLAATGLHQVGKQLTKDE